MTSDDQWAEDDMTDAEILAAQQNVLTARALGRDDDERFWLDQIIILERR